MQPQTTPAAQPLYRVRLQRNRFRLFVTASCNLLQTQNCRLTRQCLQQQQNTLETANHANIALENVRHRRSCPCRSRKFKQDCAFFFARMNLQMLDFCLSCPVPCAADDLTLRRRRPDNGELLIISTADLKALYPTSTAASQDMTSDLNLHLDSQIESPEDARHREAKQAEGDDIQVRTDSTVRNVACCQTCTHHRPLGATLGIVNTAPLLQPAA